MPTEVTVGESIAYLYGGRLRRWGARLGDKVQTIPCGVKRLIAGPGVLPLDNEVVKSADINPSAIE